MRFVKSAKVGFNLLSVALIIGGACLLIWPDVSATAICVVLGVLSLLYGVVRLLGYFSDDLYRLAFQFDLAVGILTIILGGVLILHPRDVLGNLPIVIGLILLVDSVLRLQTSIDARHFGMEKWWAILLVSIVGMAVGTSLLLRPFESSRALVRLMGAALMLHGGENLLVCLYTVKVPRRSDPDVIDVEYTVEENDDDSDT